MHHKIMVLAHIVRLRALVAARAVCGRRAARTHARDSPSPGNTLPKRLRSATSPMARVRAWPVQSFLVGSFPGFFRAATWREGNSLTR